MNSRPPAASATAAARVPTRHTELNRRDRKFQSISPARRKMAKVDDLLERRAKQVVLAIVAAGSSVSPTANLAVEGITDRPNRESQTAIKPACTPGFLAKSITCSGQIIAIDQSLPNSSRTTKPKSRQDRRAARIADHVEPHPNDSVLTLSPLAQSHHRNYGA
jgi:hypothetical protein